MKQSEIENRLNILLEFIRQFQKSNGKTPSYREIQRECGYSSIGSVAADVCRLKEQGSIEVAEGTKWRHIAIPAELKSGATRPAPIVGSCPCGEPITAIENIEATVALPIEIFGNCEHIILRAKGRSMINRGIFNGDLMVVRVQSSAEVGDVVVARVNGEEATAKILAQKNGKFYLKPANDEVDENGKRKYKNIYPEGEWDIIGVVDNVIHAPMQDIRQ